MRQRLITIFVIIDAMHFFPNGLKYPNGIHVPNPDIPTGICPGGFVIWDMANTSFLTCNRDQLGKIKSLVGRFKAAKVLWISQEAWDLRSTSYHETQMRCLELNALEICCPDSFSMKQNAPRELKPSSHLEKNGMKNWDATGKNLTTTGPRTELKP